MGSSSVAATSWDVGAVRRDFPMLERVVRGRPIAYLDNAATALKPKAVGAAMGRYFDEYCANVARGVHTASQEATSAYEAVRDRVAGWINADGADEIVFSAGTTASLNLLAQSLARPRLGAGDEILVSELEHHSNIVPWQLVAEATGARVRRIPVTDAGELDLEALERLCSERTKIVAVAHASNVVGTILPIERIAAIAHRVGGLVVVDGAQGAPHLLVDVRGLGCDAYVFSGHKAFGPTGVGVLWARRELLQGMPPWQGGGGMIASVEIERSTYAPPPARFEAGTPAIAEVIGLGAAIEYLEGWDRAAGLAYEDGLLAEAVARLAEVAGVRCFGQSERRVAVLAFTVDGVHPHDVGTALDAEGVAVRAGHHCAQPLMKRFGVPAMVRASFAPYNTSADVDALVRGVKRAQSVFGV
ncbi:MAG: SufS family cysteine desulfurase [Gemmatimonadales bacterium]